MGKLAIETSGLKKSFGTTHAVAGVDLAVSAGGVYGVLGPNGAGKTTTIRMLATLLRPDAGEAQVLGYDVVRDAQAVRSRVGLTGQFASVDEDLTGVENLLLLARLLGYSRPRGRRRAADLLDAFGLANAADRQVKKYSGGMRRRIDIAASLVVPPELIFLDEPTTGLDPRSRNQVWEIVRGLVAEGATVLLTTQYRDEADQLADRIAVIDHGKVIAEGSSGQLKASVGAGSLHVRLRAPEQRAEAERVLAGVLEVQVEPSADNPAHSANAITGTRPGHDKEGRMSTIPKNNSETVAHTPGRASSIGAWILQVVLAATIAGGGISKLAGDPVMVDMFADIGAGQWLRYLVGALEVAGGVGLLIPALAGLASLGLAALLTGAVLTDQFVLEQSPWLPLALLAVATVIARARWSRTEAVVGTLLRR